MFGEIKMFKTLSKIPSLYTRRRSTVYCCWK